MRNMYKKIIDLFIILLYNMNRKYNKNRTNKNTKREGKHEHFKS